MAKSLTVGVRFSAEQIKQLDLLRKKLGLDRTNTIRVALARLAEAEGLLKVDTGDFVR